MKRVGVLVLIFVCLFSLFSVSIAEGESFVSSVLDRNEQPLTVKCALSDGLSVEFVYGAFYVYDGDFDSETKAIAVGVTLSEDAYRDYSENSEYDFVEYSDGVRKFVESADKSQNYLCDLGDDLYFLFSVYGDYDADSLFDRIEFSVDNSSGGSLFGESSIYNDNDIYSAIEAIGDIFFTWDGCVLDRLEYAGDGCFTDETLAWINDQVDDKKYTQCIEFLMDFYTEDSDVLAGLSLDPDMEYKNYEWWLARTASDEHWELVTYGY